MTQALTDKTMVVVSRIGDFWVNPNQASEIIRIKQTDPQGSIVIDGNLVSCQSIDGVLKPDEYETLNNKRRGLWQCNHRKWHNRNDPCYCGRNITRSTPPAPQLSDEQRAKAGEKLAEIRSKIGNGGVKSLKGEKK